MKLVKAGVMNEDFLTLYRSNCRTPEVNLGDIQAMLAALQVGEKRVLELVAAHGVDTVMQAQRDLVAYAGAKARQVQRLILTATTCSGTTSTTTIIPASRSA